MGCGPSWPTPLINKASWSPFKDRLAARARNAGATWTQIAEVLSVSVQAIHNRYRRIRHHRATGGVWHEPPPPI